MRVVTRRQLAPLSLPGFRYLFLATLGSSLGTLLAGIALAIDVKDRTNSGPWVAAASRYGISPSGPAARRTALRSPPGRAASPGPPRGR